MTKIYFQMWGHKISVLCRPFQSLECQDVNAPDLNPLVGIQEKGPHEHTEE